MRKKHLVPRSDGELMYSTPPTLRRYLPMFLNLAVYMVTFVLWLYLDTAYYGFGHKIITPLTGSMWIVGAVFALLLPSQREEIIRYTKCFILGYLGILFVYRYVIIAVSGVSADNLTAAFNQAVAASSATAVIGFKICFGSLPSPTRLPTSSSRPRKSRSSLGHGRSGVRSGTSGIFGTIPNPIKPQEGVM